MDKLCFGNFARIIQPALQKPNSNQAVVELLLNLVTNMADVGHLSENYTIKPSKVSGLWNFKEDLNEDVINLSTTRKVISSMPEAFNKNIVSSIVSTQTEDLIENLKKLLILDKSIAPAKRNALLALACIEDIAGFLSAVFLYSISRPNKITLNMGDKKDGSELGIMFDDFDMLNEVFNKRRKPTDLTSSFEPSSDELMYVSALIAAYSEALNAEEFLRNALTSYRKLSPDMRKQQKEYYVMETINRANRILLLEKMIVDLLYKL